MNWAIERLGERSTWLGLLGLMVSAGMYIAPELQPFLIMIATGIGGAIGVVIKDKRRD